MLFISNLRLEQATGLAFRFVIERSKDAKKMAELEKEIEKFQDFIIIDVEEEYFKLSYKIYSWAYGFLFCIMGFKQLI